MVASMRRSRAGLLWGLTPPSTKRPLTPGRLQFKGFGVEVGRGGGAGAEEVGEGEVAVGGVGGGWIDAGGEVFAVGVVVEEPDAAGVEAFGDDGESALEPGAAEGVGAEWRRMVSRRLSLRNLGPRTPPRELRLWRQWEARPVGKWVASVGSQGYGIRRSGDGRCGIHGFAGRRAREAVLGGGRGVELPGVCRGHRWS